MIFLGVLFSIKSTSLLSYVILFLSKSLATSTIFFTSGSFILTTFSVKFAYSLKKRLIIISGIASDANPNLVIDVLAPDVIYHIVVALSIGTRSFVSAFTNSALSFVALL